MASIRLEIVALSETQRRGASFASLILHFPLRLPENLMGGSTARQAYKLISLHLILVFSARFSCLACSHASASCLFYANSKSVSSDIRNYALFCNYLSLQPPAVSACYFSAMHACTEPPVSFFEQIPCGIVF